MPLAATALLVPLAHAGDPSDAWAPTATAETQAVSRWHYLLTRERGEYQEALRLFELAVRLDPKLAAAWNNLGEMYELAGMLDDALREYREAVRLAPRLVEAQQNLARLTVRLGAGARRRGGPALTVSAAAARRPARPCAAL